MLINIIRLGILVFYELDSFGRKKLKKANTIKFYSAMHMGSKHTFDYVQSRLPFCRCYNRSFVLCYYDCPVATISYVRMSPDFIKFSLPFYTLDCQYCVRHI